MPLRKRKFVFSRMIRKKLKKNLRRTENHLTSLPRFLVKKPCPSVGFTSNARLGEFVEKYGYEKFINNNWLCFFVRRDRFRERAIFARPDHGLLAWRRPASRMFQWRAAARGP